MNSGLTVAYVTVAATWLLSSPSSPSLLSNLPASMHGDILILLPIFLKMVGPLRDGTHGLKLNLFNGLIRKGHEEFLMMRLRVLCVSL